MANFTVSNSSANGGSAQAACSGTYKSLVVTNNSTATSATYAGIRRGKWYDILVGTNGTPADNYMEFDVVRATYATSTALTTGGAVFISSLSSTYALDGADAAAVASVTVNSSVETYLTSPTEMWYVGVNQRASYRWVAAPGSEIVYPANSSAAINGMALRARSGGYTGTVTGNILFQEQ